jgi:hypothetical protein
VIHDVGGKQQKGCQGLLCKPTKVATHQSLHNKITMTDMSSGVHVLEGEGDAFLKEKKHKVLAHRSSSV